MSKNQTSIHDRIIQILEKFNLTHSSFARKIGISRGTISDMLKKRDTTPSYNTLEQILTKIPEINGDWLLTGRGSMLIKDVRIKELEAGYRDKMDLANFMMETSIQLKDHEKRIVKLESV